MNERTGCCFAAQEIFFAEEAGVVEQVELFAGGQLPATQGARETSQVVNFVTRLPH